MYFIIAGGGEVGYYLARMLLADGHEILVIEKDRRRCELISEEMGDVVIRGDACEARTLEEMGTARADMLIAVTGDDEDNLVACQLAKHKFNVSRTIARINNPKNETIFKKLGIDVTVSSTNVILENIEQEVPTHPLTHLLSLKEKGLEIVGVKIPADSTTVGKAVRELSLPEDSVLSLIISKERKPQLATPDTVIQAEDEIIAVTTPASEEALRSTLRATS